MRLGILLFPSLMLVVSACGGSSSETPWPAEPEGTALGPPGETSAPVAPNTPIDAPEPPAAEPTPPDAPDAGR